jgi:hypothetical protein
VQGQFRGPLSPIPSIDAELPLIEQLRERMPALRQREQTLRAELQVITDQTNDRAAFLRLAETLTEFLTPLRSAAETFNARRSPPAFTPPPERASDKALAFTRHNALDAELGCLNR